VVEPCEPWSAHPALLVRRDRLGSGGWSGRRDRNRRAGSCPGAAGGLGM